VLDYSGLQNAVKLTYSEVVAPDAVPFDVRIVRDLDIQGDQIK
jgi:hypothetical protein